MRKKDVNNSNATGDSTGYSLTVKKNYESYAQKLKDLAKKHPGNRKEKSRIMNNKKKLFAYSF